MKQNLLKTMVLGLMAMVGLNAWADDVVEVITPSVDGWIRYTSNTAKNYESGEYETKHYTKDATDNDFYAVMKFAIPNKSGMKIKSASLRLVTKKSAAKTSMAIYKLTDEVTTSSTYSTLTNFATDLAGSALGTFTIVQGERSKQLGTDKLTKEEYNTLSKWTNNITLTASSISMGSDLNLAVAIVGDRDGSDGSVNKFFSSRATDTTVENKENDNTVVFEAADIVPKLTVTYEEDLDIAQRVITPSLDGWIRDANSPTNSNYTNGTLETRYYQSGDNSTRFYGVMKFDIPTMPGYEVQSATLRLVTERVKSARAAAVYALGKELASGDNYNTIGTYVESALSGSAIGTFSTVGQDDKSIALDETTGDYQDISAWTNTISLSTAAVSGISTLSIVIAPTTANTRTQSTNYFTSETGDVTNSKLSKTFSASDLIPQLTIVYKKMDSYELNVTAAGAATLVLPFNATIPSGVKAYTLNYTAGNSAVKATEVTGTLTANTPVLVNAEKGDYTFTRTGDIVSGSAVSGALTGVYTKTTVPRGSYILTYKDSKVGFRTVDGTTNYVNAYRAYLTADDAGAPEFLTIDFGGEVTGINEVIEVKGVNDNSWYDLQGRRVAQPKKGLYIVNGKKVVLK